MNNSVNFGSKENLNLVVMTNQDIFNEAWEIAKAADKAFNYYGGAKQYFNEALKLAYAGYTAENMLSSRELSMAKRLIENINENFTYTQLDEHLFLFVVDNTNQYVFCKTSMSLSINRLLEETKIKFNF